MLKIWFVLKQMGLKEDGPPVAVTTSSPAAALTRLFAFGASDGDFFVPFSHTRRFATMKRDADRSIIQTNVKRWQESGSVVGTDPTGYIDFSEGPNQEVLVRPGRRYPVGLGWSKDGFAREESTRVTIPALAFAVWYGRQSDIPRRSEPAKFLIERMTEGLQLSRAESEAIFVDVPLRLELRATPLTDREINRIVTEFLKTASDDTGADLIAETYQEHSRRVRAMTSLPEGPRWLRVSPSNTLQQVLDSGCRAVILLGPPRTGKTRAVDQWKPRTDRTRETIQIHDGWGYDELMISFRPSGTSWQWTPGPLLRAIRDGKKVIVLEEINRTNFTQALGEVFSLAEPSYRGENSKLKLRDGTDFWIPADVVLICTMNNVDKSTEDVDDAVFGRFAAVEFPPRVEDLISMLEHAGVSEPVRRKLAELFAAIQLSYPLGHGYFADCTSTTTPLQYYLTRIRPVLKSHLQHLRETELTAIDNLADTLFNVD